MEYCKMCGGAASLFDHMARTPVVLEGKGGYGTGVLSLL